MQLHPAARHPSHAFCLIRNSLLVSCFSYEEVVGVGELPNVQYTRRKEFHSAVSSCSAMKTDSIGLVWKIKQLHANKPLA